MGRGRGLCSQVGGKENPAIAAWALAAALLAAAAVTLLLLAEATQLKDQLGEGLKPEEYGKVLFVSRGTFLGLGCTYTVACACCAAVTLCGYFFWAKLLCLACPLLLLCQLLCLVAAAFGGYMLQQLEAFRSSQVELLRAPGGAAAAAAAAAAADFSLQFLDAHASLVLLFAAASLAAIAPLAKAAAIDEKGTMVDVLLHLPLLSGCIATAAVLLLPSRCSLNVGLGAGFLVAAAAAAALAALQHCGGLLARVSALLLAAFYLLLLLLSLACLLAVGRQFADGRAAAIRYLRVGPLQQTAFLLQLEAAAFENFKQFYLLNKGAFGLAAVALAAAVAAYSFFAAAFSLRAAVGGADALRRDISEASSDKP
ncbi:hypothetical protein, conserved [Eimeria tenella]|uniref:Uncharacterized protein n=1 Tax=Eimeria tenella TaxID=5802 RepID=U6KKU8_EIMTE|nr:hypothetical protein, conserved [Eimeria tenella]CDJ37431.1 hypothetical protein, conserved [Eimeria tenella]|eukprot:XP_013228269.1 hypothetical protein, conserved [Eimeria tenella]